MREEGLQWSITVVYGPQLEADKVVFLSEIESLQPSMKSEWLIIGDFNLIYRASDKNSDRLNRRMMQRFRGLLDKIQVKELQLPVRRFTWAGEGANPTQTKIDRSFVTTDWDLMFESSNLYLLSSACSDHAPLFLVGNEQRSKFPSFRFESFWLKIPGFLEAVQDSWQRPILATNCLAIFRIKLRCLARDLKRWSRSQVGDIKLQLAVASKVVFQLDIAQETRTLSDDERLLVSNLKNRILALSVLNKIQIRQRSRQTWLKEGDVNSNFFHIKANSRRRKNYIQSLHTPSGIAISAQDKEEELLRFFKERIGSRFQRTSGINWNMMDLPSLDLGDLEEDITEEELKKTVFSMPPEKAPGPDGFIGAFFKSAWEIINEDLLSTVRSFFDLNTLQIKDLNSAFICLLPKKEDALGAEHYRPISLIHSFSKIISKILANRLAPRLCELVSTNQSAFVRKRAIHDNFVFVKNMVQYLHRTKKTSLFIKIDIAKAFDTVCWPYLLEVLRQFGFGIRWLNWISNLLATSSSQMLLNGSSGQSINHVRGLRQGDPLSPMLFILAMEPFHRIIKAVENASLLFPMGGSFDRFRCSLYVDDVAVFVKPQASDLSVLMRLLTFFAQTSGLHTNISKTEIYPIRCENINLVSLLANFPGMVKQFPCRYLGLPLHIRKLRKIDFLPLIEKIGSRIPGWKGRFFTSAGTKTQVQSILSSMPIHHFTALQVPKWVIKRIDRFRRSFLCKGEDPDKTNPGSSLVNWQTVCKPKILGGLGILDLERFSRALRLRWLWLGWKDENKPWAGMSVPCDDTDKRLFQAATTIELGNGTKTSFWHDNWLRNNCPKDIAPLCFKLAKRKQKSVQQELHNNNWLISFRQITSVEEIHELVHLGSMLQGVLLIPRPDDISWNWNESKVYTIYAQAPLKTLIICLVNAPSSRKFGL
uniref:Retrotransposon protein, putative, unclassified n=2 Tax=Oryza sativa subsp. japonica TaxID=39947 RepID=Q53LX3_ORYSJ|nr:retrotransposon protein, putative, unclassified [Oryza sativa Japonica Group]ABG22397.1 retrotransposon protein, putative, unclassified [Oryza sativa Japonica Group]